MEVVIVPYAADNYAYLARRESAREAVVVDAGEAAPVLAAVDSFGLELRAVLSTHHHGDHVGGNAELRRAIPSLRVYGAAETPARVPGLTDPLPPDGRFEVASMQFVALAVPGHTRSGLAFAGHGWVFTGDTLFGAGCGRLFEGTAAELHGSLRRMVESFPSTTRAAFGHEYTMQNLRFAARMEPGNLAIAARAARVAKLRAEGRPSTPSTLAEELATNPFLRTKSPELRARLGRGEDDADADVFGELRALKDRS
ncbi:MAG: hydroxyacylglutathione hydrolase [Polyangiaceae bacterium]|nr:hydroxyacylglutathione hydrolase [Polyangiaceae bacterium]